MLVCKNAKNIVATFFSAHKAYNGQFSRVIAHGTNILYVTQNPHMLGGSYDIKLILSYETPFFVVG
jgi:hypothetical protein